MTVGDIIRFFANRNPDKVAIYYLDKTFTYTSLNIRVNKLANKLLSLGFRPNDNVSILLRNCFQYLEIVLALAKIGATPVPVNFRLVREEIKYILNDSDSRGLFLEEEFIEKIMPIKSQVKVEFEKYYLVGSTLINDMTHYENLITDSSPEEPKVRVDENSCFIIRYTSGTTGRPKGTVVSHKSRLLMFLAQAMEFKVLEDDIHLAAAPFCHAIGLLHSLQQLAVGGTVCIMRQFDAEEALRLIEDKKVTNTAMVPTMYNLILELPENTQRKYDCGSMRVLFSAGAPLPTRIKKGVIEFFHNAGLIEFYGLSECGFVTYLKPCDQLKKIRSVGKPFWGVEIKLINENNEEVGDNEVGEIVPQSPYIMDGYYKRGKEGFRAERFYTGDLARRDEDGYFYIVDRKNDMIISGGENIYPAEIEEVLYSHPKTSEAAVIGIPDERWGESVKALIILRKGESSTEDEIIEFCRKRLAGFKIPRSVSFLTEFPKSSSGKILKRILREEYWKGRKVKV